MRFENIFGPVRGRVCGRPWKVMPSRCGAWLIPLGPVVGGISAPQTPELLLPMLLPPLMFHPRRQKLSPIHIFSSMDPCVRSIAVLKGVAAHCSIYLLKVHEFCLIEARCLRCICRVCRNHPVGNICKCCRCRHTVHAHCATVPAGNQHTKYKPHAIHASSCHYA